ncbi:hypothetical protein [Novosphingobium sp. HII-3]|uniref:hypothetical protein n=1 Tax=Novosphingobium sp. HII-3 TaxID=2075565 RepID=UPI000CDB0DD7|nr:hypothetical protein [Novosphingobium sp. HII-3]
MRATLVFGMLGVATLVSGCEVMNPYREAKEAVSRNLKDPEATQFRDVRTCFKDPGIVMGEFNGKNSYGAYVGFASFYYVDGRVVLASDDDFGPLTKRCYGEDN